MERPRGREGGRRLLSETARGELGERGGRRTAWRFLQCISLHKQTETEAHEDLDEDGVMLLKLIYSEEGERAASRQMAAYGVSSP